MNRLSVCIQVLVTSRFMYAERVMVLSKTAEACDTEGKKKAKCCDMKQSKS